MTDCAPSARTAAIGPLRAVSLLIMGFVFLLALTVVSAGCGDGPPPEQTLADLGSTVGELKLDDTDFDALLQRYTVPEYAEGVAADLGNYQLYLTGKAADLALNQPEPDLVAIEKDQGRSESQVDFNFSRKEGLFAVADISKIEVQLVKTDEEQLPWRISGITLSR